MPKGNPSGYRKKNGKKISGTVSARKTAAKMKNREKLGILEASKSDYGRIQKATKLNKPKYPKKVTLRGKKKK